MTVTTSQHMGSEIEYLILNAFDTPMGGSALTDTAAPVLAFGAEVQGDYAPLPVPVIRIRCRIIRAMTSYRVR